MLDDLTPELPDAIPRKGNSVTRCLGRWLLRLLGWRVTGEFPRQKKLVIVVAPHTSNWDFITAMAGILAVGIRVNFLMKKEAFIWPLKPFFIWLGGIPIDRSATENTVEQIVSHYENHDALWLAIAPEGTRDKVDNWKTGCVRIAKSTDIPLLLVMWDYPEKRLVIDRIWPLSENAAEDMMAIRAYVRSHYLGRHPNKQ